MNNKDNTWLIDGCRHAFDVKQINCCGLVISLVNWDEFTHCLVRSNAEAGR